MGSPLAQIYKKTLKKELIAIIERDVVVIEALKQELESMKMTMHGKSSSSEMRFTNMLKNYPVLAQRVLKKDFRIHREGK